MSSREETTGRRRRAGDPDKGDWTREVPKYTQIGNAVPVWMARAIGRHLIEELNLSRGRPTDLIGVMAIPTLASVAEPPSGVASK